MSTPIIDIHSLLQEHELLESSHPTKNDDEDFVLGIELIVAFTASRFLKIDTFLPEKFVTMFGPNNFIVHLVWLLVLFFGLRHFVANEYKKRSQKSVHP